MDARLDPLERIVLQYTYVRTIYQKYTWRELVELYLNLDSAQSRATLQRRPDHDH